MKKLNQKQKNYLIEIMTYHKDLNSYDDLGYEGVVALSHLSNYFLYDDMVGMQEFILAVDNYIMYYKKQKEKYL